MRNTDMLLNFPRAKFVDENGICAQVAHLQTEADEAFRELNNTDVNVLAREVMDCLHSCETALRILEEKYHVSIASIMADVYEKNEARGYYS